MDWNTKVKLGMELIYEACKENSELLETCEFCPFETYCDIIYGTLKVSPDEPRWTKMGGEDIR